MSFLISSPSIGKLDLFQENIIGCVLLCDLQFSSSEDVGTCIAKDKQFGRFHIQYYLN